MKMQPPRLRPRILYGAYTLAALSLAWSGYAITDLMHSGPFGLSVALAGDIGWITVLWAEYQHVAIAGRRWPATVAGWLIAAGVGVLLVIHGSDYSTGQAVAGPFVVAVGKVVWVFALAAMRDPTALTPEQEAEIHSVMRDSEYEARLHAVHLRQVEQQADAEIARITAEARTVLARDDADFEIVLARADKRAEMERRTPIALPPSSEQPARSPGEHTASSANTIASASTEQIANTPPVSPNADREQPSIADLVRDQVANTTNNAAAVHAVMTARPDANKESVAAAVRRERRKSGRMKGGYA